MTASKKINGRSVVWHGSRGGSQSLRGVNHVMISCRKASEGAEKSCLSRRRKRGLRAGKGRSRAGKAPRIPPRPTLNSDIGVRRRTLQRHLREDLWASARAKMIFERVISPLEKRYGRNWRRRDGVWEKIDRVWLPFKRQVRSMHGLGDVSLKIAENYSKQQKPLVDSWDEVGFGSPHATPGDWLRFRCLVAPTVEDLFPDDGPITLGEWQRRLEVRLHRRTRSVVPCRCRRSHVYCGECGACIYAGSLHHRPRGS